jgi:hypothetical protein
VVREEGGDAEGEHGAHEEQEEDVEPGADLKDQFQTKFTD